jgi:hypothetical protein
MAPSEWPLDAPPISAGAHAARPAGPRRLRTVRRDFFLDPAERLSEQERALMTAMLADLVGSIADDLRGALPADVQAGTADGQQLATLLARAELIDRPGVIALLLRRADEERIGTAIRVRSAASSSFLQALIADTEEAISATAMALILARGRRRDRLGQPRIEYDDLQPEDARAMAFAVAAALRLRSDGGDDCVLDAALAAAASALLERQNRERSLDEVTNQLVSSLALAGRLDDAMLGLSVNEGDVGFLAQSLAHRAGISLPDSWDLMLGGGLAALLRLAGLEREFAAQLLAGIGDIVGVVDLGAEIQRFEQMRDEQVAADRAWLSLPPPYRAALAATEARHG